MNQRDELQPLFDRGYRVDTISLVDGQDTYSLYVRAAPYHVLRVYQVGGVFQSETLSTNAKTLAEAHAHVVHRAAELEVERSRLPACTDGGRAARCTEVRP